MVSKNVFSIYIIEVESACSTPRCGNDCVFVDSFSECIKKKNIWVCLEYFVVCFEISWVLVFLWVGYMHLSF